MFDFSQVERDELKLALGTAVGIGIVSFATSMSDGLAGRLGWAVAMAAVAAVTVVLFTALD
ncbi:hypothetical protein OB920_09825 [Halobacteria archaeon HArc-gm2]|nr:hypothetical protein [Halobacteria archaeon HArc-gm2]